MSLVVASDGITALVAIGSLVISGIALGVSALSYIHNQKLIRQAQRVRITQLVGEVHDILSTYEVNHQRGRSLSELVLRWLDRAETRLDQSQKDSIDLPGQRQKVEQMLQLSQDALSKLGTWQEELKNLEFAESQANQDRLEQKLHSFKSGMMYGQAWYRDIQEIIREVEPWFQLMLRSPLSPAEVKRRSESDASS